MSSIDLLDNYLYTHFPNLNLSPPLFYNASIGIRFEMGLAGYLDIDKKRYMEQAYSRSQQLFEEIHAPNDEIFILVDTFRSIKEPISKTKKLKVFSHFIRDKNILYKLDCIQLPLPDEEEGDSHWVNIKYVLRCKVSDIFYSRMLNAIANHEVGLKPRIYYGCYFINPKTHTIFYFYDDRGLDIIASNKEALKDIYVKYNDWILDYDRERIDLIFSS